MIKEGNIVVNGVIQPLSTGSWAAGKGHAQRTRRYLPRWENTDTKINCRGKAGEHSRYPLNGLATYNRVGVTACPICLLVTRPQ